MSPTFVSRSKSKNITPQDSNNNICKPRSVSPRQKKANKFSVCGKKMKLQDIGTKIAQEK